MFRVIFVIFVLLGVKNTEPPPVEIKEWKITREVPRDSTGYDRVEYTFNIDTNTVVYPHYIKYFN